MTGMYCQACRERMMVNGTWTEAHAKRQNEFYERRRAHYARMPEEEKAALRARKRTNYRNFRARNPDARKAADAQRYKNIKLDPVKWEARRQYMAEYGRKRRLNEKEKKRKRALTDVNDDDDGDDSDAPAPPALAQIAIRDDSVVVISDDDEADSGADISGSSVEVIEFVYSDEE